MTIKTRPFRASYNALRQWTLENHWYPFFVSCLTNALAFAHSGPRNKLIKRFQWCGSLGCQGRAWIETSITPKRNYPHEVRSAVKVERGLKLGLLIIDEEQKFGVFARLSRSSVD